jgi:DNA-binding response OmpR family regulator
MRQLILKLFKIERYGVGLKPKVLVLDDDRLALELYSRELNAYYQITTSESISEARRNLRSSDYDAMIIEPAVNDGEGWALLGEIFSSPAPPMVIICSVEDERKAGLEQGAHAFLVKPVLPTALHTLLDQILDKKSSQIVHKLEKGYD